MKKFVALLLAVLMILSCFSAVAETKIDSHENRKIKLQKVGEVEIIEGISATTGLTLEDLEVPDDYAGLAATGRYQPMLVQIDNTDGGVNARAPWGIGYADIVYETPLHKNGATRMSFLYSDVIPTSVGPVRSARIGHAWLREEWGAGFLFYGQQEYAKINVLTEFKNLQSNYMHDAKGKRIEISKGKYEMINCLFRGTVSEGESHPWKAYYTGRQGMARPHHIDANVAAMCAMINENYVPPVRGFRFTDDFLTEGEDVNTITITTAKKSMYNSQIEYDMDSNMYYRYLRQTDKKKKVQLYPYQDYDSGEQVGFSNVIIQWADVEWTRSDAPVQHLVAYDLSFADGVGGMKIKGEGNADIFMCGKHIAGYWKRASMDDRTVFYDADGNEIELQRGKTFISIADGNLWEVAYE